MNEKREQTFSTKTISTDDFEFVEICFVQIFEIKMNMCIQIKMYRDVLSLNPEPDIGNDLYIINRKGF